MTLVDAQLRLFDLNYLRRLVFYVDYLKCSLKYFINAKMGII